MRVFIVLVLVLAAVPAIAQTTFGGTDWQKPDSMDVAYLYSTSPLVNFGGSGTFQIRIIDDGVDAMALLRMKYPDTTSGLTIDYVIGHWFWASGGPAGANDTFWVYAYILNKDWGEGVQTGDPAIAGEASFDSAKHANGAGLDWTTDGARHFTDDRNATLVDSFFVGGIQSGGEEYTITIPGQYITSDFFNFGVGLYAGRDNCSSCWFAFRFDSDDGATVAERPYFEGFYADQKPKRKRKAN